MEPLKKILESEKSWIQGALLAVLVGGLALAAWLLRNREMEFIYSLF